MQGTGRGSLHNPLLQICLTMAQASAEMQLQRTELLGGVEQGRVNVMRSMLTWRISKHKNGQIIDRQLPFFSNAKSELQRETEDH
ncbi:hypothetical protein MITS9504_01789 [Synechococcus sp. MIT S9504]|nr:hypothetical protein MITS9504_01789 [Synechococcus sp. MIT S9504]